MKERWKAAWEKVCSVCRILWNGTKKACFATGRFFAAFGRWCAHSWMKYLAGPAKKLFFVHWSIAVVLVVISAALLLYAFLLPGANPYISYFGYFVSAYTLAVVCVKLPGVFGRAKRGLYANRYSGRYLTDAVLRAEISMYAGLGVSFFYAVFKMAAGIYYHSTWLGALAIYYIILSAMRFALVKHYRDNAQHENEREQRLFGLRSYRFCGILMFLLNIAVTILVGQLIWSNESYEYPGFLIYAFAGYSFYCIGIAVWNMAKHRKLETPILAAAKMLSFACALMSILATQTAMLTQFGDGQETFAQIMNAMTGSVVCLLIFGLAVWMVHRANRELKGMEE